MAFFEAMYTGEVKGRIQDAGFRILVEPETRMLHLAPTQVSLLNSYKAFS